MKRNIVFLLAGIIATSTVSTMNVKAQDTVYNNVNTGTDTVKNNSSNVDSIISKLEKSKQSYRELQDILESIKINVSNNFSASNYSLSGKYIKSALGDHLYGLITADMKIKTDYEQNDFSSSGDLMKEIERFRSSNESDDNTYREDNLEILRVMEQELKGMENYVINIPSSEIAGITIDINKMYDQEDLNKLTNTINDQIDKINKFLEDYNKLSVINYDDLDYDNDDNSNFELSVTTKDVNNVPKTYLDFDHLEEQVSSLDVDRNYDDFEENYANSLEDSKEEMRKIISNLKDKSVEIDASTTQLKSDDASKKLDKISGLSIDRGVITIGRGENSGNLNYISLDTLLVQLAKFTNNDIIPDVDQMNNTINSNLYEILSKRINKNSIKDLYNYINNSGNNDNINDAVSKFLSDTHLNNSQQSLIALIDNQINELKGNKNQITTDKNVNSNKNENKSLIKNSVEVIADNKIIKVNGEEKELDIAPYISNENNSMMVPIRCVVYALGLSDDQVKWDEKTAIVTVDTGDKVIKIKTNDNNTVSNTKNNILDLNAEIKDNRVFIPFRSLGETLNIKVDWNADTLTATYNFNK